VTSSCSEIGRPVSDDRAQEDVRRRIRILIVRLGVEVGKVEDGLREIRSIDRSQNGKLLGLSRCCGLLDRFCSKLSYFKVPTWIFTQDGSLGNKRGLRLDIKG